MRTDSLSLGHGILYDGLGKPIGTCTRSEDVDTVFPEGTNDYGHPITLSKAFEAELDGKINAKDVEEFVMSVNRRALNV